MPDPKTILASRDQLGCVYECACGTIHVAVGPVDLKFTRESLLETFEMLRDAVEQLKPGSAEDPSSEHVVIDSSGLHFN
jgi:ribosomal protein L1